MPVLLGALFASTASMTEAGRAINGTTPPIEDFAASGQADTLIQESPAATAVDWETTEPGGKHRITSDFTEATGPDDGGATSASAWVLAFFAAIAAVMTLTVVASTRTAVARQTRRRRRS